MKDESLSLSCSLFLFRVKKTREAHFFLLRVTAKNHSVFTPVILKVTMCLDKINCTEDVGVFDKRDRDWSRIFVLDTKHSYRNGTSWHTPVRA